VFVGHRSRVIPTPRHACCFPSSFSAATRMTLERRGWSRCSGTLRSSSPSARPAWSPSGHWQTSGEGLPSSSPTPPALSHGRTSRCAGATTAVRRGCRTLGSCRCVVGLWGLDGIARLEVVPLRHFLRATRERCIVPTADRARAAAGGSDVGRLQLHGAGASLRRSYVGACVSPSTLYRDLPPIPSPDPVA
jgi:hypothetical protein